MLIGHFGTYGAPVADQLRPVLLGLLHRVPGLSALLLGRGGEAFRDGLIRAEPALAGRLAAPGGLDPAALSCHLQACDLMLQPYPDGVSCRRTSVMAALAHGKPVVTNAAHSTEPFWSESGAAVVVPGVEAPAIIDAAARLLADPDRRRTIGAAAALLHEERFALRRTITALREETS